ncbi:MAG: radical SAM protein [Candidatus Heimdallarchaeota archaeon]
MTSDKSIKKKNSYTLDLTSLLPFKILLSEKENSLELIRGLMSGKINLDSIKLEIEKFFPILEEDIIFMVDNFQKVTLEYSANAHVSTKDVEILVQEVISKELPLTLFNRSTKKPMTYITRNLLGIPLIGSLYFGVIDRGTNLLQIRAITGCPLNCPFCSVDEGPASQTKIRDFIVDTDYLVDTYNQVVSEKLLKNAEAHLDGQGEPMSYPYLVELVQKLNDNPATNVVSIQTNGWFLEEKLIDELAEVNLSRINLSINTLNTQMGKKLSGRGDYPLEKILELAEYIANSNISLLLAPLWIPGVNDDDIEEIIKFSLKINSNGDKYPSLGIQNYLLHNQGRNMKGIKQKSFSDFNKQLREFEKRLGGKDLVLKPYMFNNYKTEMIQNPMKVNEIIDAKVVLFGRKENEIFAIAKNRLIHVINADNASIGKRIKVRIIRNRHNIFFAKPV